jgi:acyl CoA:acetate/3-ketoacid CoA transferase
VGSKIKILEAAANLVRSGDTLVVGASSGVSVPDAVLGALGKKFETSGAPGNLTVIFPINVGDMFGQKGLDHLASEGQVQRLIGGSYPSGPSGAEPPAIRRLIEDQKVLAYNLPVGVITALVGETAAKGPGVLTDLGLGTFIDEEFGGGGMNQRSKSEPFAKRVELLGKTYLFFPSQPINVAIIRATTADQHGNLTFENEGALIAPYTLAAAAKANRGIVIAQVERCRDARVVDPKAVKVPGYMVDAVVVAPDQMQATHTRYDPAISGQDWAPVSRLPCIEDPVESLITRRIGGQVHAGEVAVLGYGVCANLPALLARSGEIDLVSFVIEQGSVGGIPLTGFQFGCSYNAQAYLDTSLAFDYLRGGGFDVALLSFLQIDAAGNLNVSHLPSKPHITAGIGGFMDIVHNAPRLVFAGRLRGGASKISVEPNALAIETEGSHAKFVKEVDQVTVTADALCRGGRDVKIVTERCTFSLEADGLHLIEIVPGIDPKSQVIDLCDVPVYVREPLTVMDKRLFLDNSAPLLG